MSVCITAYWCQMCHCVLGSAAPSTRYAPRVDLTLQSSKVHEGSDTQFTYYVLSRTALASLAPGQSLTISAHSGGQIARLRSIATSSTLTLSDAGGTRACERGDWTMQASSSAGNEQVLDLVHNEGRKPLSLEAMIVHQATLCRATRAVRG